MATKNDKKGKIFYETAESCEVRSSYNYKGLVRRFSEIFDVIAMTIVVAVIILIAGRIYLMVAQDPAENLLAYLIYGLSDPVVGVFSQIFHFTNITDLIQSAVISIVIYIILIYGLHKGTRLIRRKYKERSLAR